MLDLKQYLSLKERAYFVDLATLSEDVINQLQEKLAKKKSIRSGDTITVSIGDMYDLDIKLYKGRSHAARAEMQQNPTDNESGASAMYFPETAESNGRIEIYVNASKKDQDYYKERKFEDFINKSLPKYIKDMLRHEIAHAYEDIVQDVGRFKNNRPTSQDEYINSDDEVNAHFMGWLPGEIQNNQMVQYHLMQAHNAEDETQKQTAINRAVKAVLNKLPQEHWMGQVSDATKKWILKTTYTYMTDMVDLAGE